MEGLGLRSFSIPVLSSGPALFGRGLKNEFVRTLQHLSIFGVTCEAEMVATIPRVKGDLYVFPKHGTIGSLSCRKSTETVCPSLVLYPNILW